MKLTTQDVLEWPVTKTDKDGGNVKVYQGFDLKNFNYAVIKTCSDQALANLKSLDNHMH